MYWQQVRTTLPHYLLGGIDEVWSRISLIESKFVTNIILLPVLYDVYAKYSNNFMVTGSYILHCCHEYLCNQNSLSFHLTLWISVLLLFINAYQNHSSKNIRHWWLTFREDINTVMALTIMYLHRRPMLIHRGWVTHCFNLFWNIINWTP